MLYRYIQFFVWIALRLFYRHRSNKNFKYLGRKKPTIIISNHVNAFIDPILVASEMRKSIYFLARGDVFKPGIISRILTSFHIIPIFRMEEGGAADERMEKNNLTFEKCFELLQKNNTIKLYPEAICVQEKRIRKLRKGASRIALGAGERSNYDLDLQIIPLGINYSDAKKFGSSVFINVGEPIDLKSFFQLHKTDKVRAINELTSLLESELKKLVIHINNKENDVAYEQLTAMFGWRIAKINHHNPEKEYYANLKIADYINKTCLDEPAKWENIKHHLKDYFNILNQHKLRDHLFQRPKNFLLLAFNSIFIAMLLPIHFLGLVFNYIPFILSHIIAKKVVRTVEFHASIAVGASIFIWKLFYLQILIVFGLITGSLQAAIYLLAVMATSGLFSFLFYPMIKKTIGSWRLFVLQLRYPQVFSRIIQLRSLIIKEVDRLFI